MLPIADSFVAHVTFLTSEQGGRRRSPRNPAVSQLAVSNLLLSCNVVAIDERGHLADLGELTLGKPFLVRIVVDHAVHYASELETLGPKIELFEGRKRVGLGIMQREGCLEPTPLAVDTFIRKSGR